MSDGVRNRQRGPFQANQLRSGDPYELSQGHPIHCAPTGTDGTGPNGLGFAVLDSDPAVFNAGVDTGIQVTNDTLRAPDVAVNFRKGTGTWAESAPLALEYAGRGQDEADLKVKIRELLAAGTRWVWVVRLVGPRRVEVHAADVAVRVVGEHDSLEAPGVLALPVPVRALFERDAAHEITLRNLLASKGYANLEALREEGREQGREQGREEGEALGLLTGLRTAVRETFAARSWTLSDAQAERVASCRDPATLTTWITQVVTADGPDAVFAAVTAPR